MADKFEVWPLGKVPEEWQRPEIKVLQQDYGYTLSDPRDAVAFFEEAIADYAGSSYAVAVDNATDALFLCLKYLASSGDSISIPKRTYLSVPMAILNAGCEVVFDDREWSGSYQLAPYNIYDSSTRFTRGMYTEGYHCLSFQYKKRLPIGKGGMILTDDKEAADWFRMASFEGRHLDVDQWSDQPTVVGWNMYMPPEDAARGLLLFHGLGCKNHEGGVFADTATHENYADLTTKTIFS